MSHEFRLRGSLRNAAVLIPLFLCASCITTTDGNLGCAETKYDEYTDPLEDAAREAKRERESDAARADAAEREREAAAEAAATETGQAAPTEGESVVAGVAKEACVGSAAVVAACELGFDWGTEGPLEPAYDQDLSNEGGGYVPPEEGPPPPLP